MVDEYRLHTIGYGTTVPSGFIYQLKKHGIGMLVDVRSNPNSSFAPMFRKANLALMMRERSVGYVWLGRVLGGRANIRTDDPRFIEAMDKVLHLTKANKVAMMCAEADPRECHRAGKLAAWVLRNRPEVKVLHIQGRDAVDAAKLETGVNLHDFLDTNLIT